MNRQLRSVCLVANGLVERNLPLQPWRYLSEVAGQLAEQGHRVTVITDGGRDDQVSLETLRAASLHRLDTVRNPHWRNNARLQVLIEDVAPGVLLWHVGLTSLLHQRVATSNRTRVVAIFTSPLYQPQELGRLGLRRLLKGHHLSVVHVLGTLAPHVIVRKTLRKASIDRFVAQTYATAEELVARGLPAQKVTVIAPGVNPGWNRRPSGVETARLRERLGYTESDFVVLYFGSPAPLRGLHTLIRAFARAKPAAPRLKLLVLSRRRADELMEADRELNALLQESSLREAVQVISGYLPEEVLVQHVASSDIVALPFELVPSDAPLSLLEAQALGKPVITTRVGCLPELVEKGQHYLAEPGDEASLADALTQALQLGRHALSGPEQDALAELPARGWQQMGEEWSNFVQRV